MLKTLLQCEEKENYMMMCFRVCVHKMLALG